MIHMLVRDGWRSPVSCWPVREMWQRLVCRDKLESVACSSQSLQGLAETPIGSCLSSLSFISFCFHPFMFPRFLDPYLTLSLFPRLPHLWPSFHIGLVSICRLLADFTQTHGSSQTISPRARFRCFTLSASISNLIQSVAETQHVLLAHICDPPSSRHTHTIKQTGTHVLKLTNTHPINIIIHYSILEYISLQDYNTGEWGFSIWFELDGEWSKEGEMQEEELPSFKLFCTEAFQFHYKSQFQKAWMLRAIQPKIELLVGWTGSPHPWLLCGVIRGWQWFSVPFCCLVWVKRNIWKAKGLG